MNQQEIKKKRRVRRKFSIRRKISGTEDRLRLTINRTLNHIYVQIINDVEGKTMVSASTVDKEVRSLLKPDMKKTDMSKIVGSVVAKRAIEKNIKKVAFDRNGFLYHGRVKALADAAREAGLEF